MQTVKWGTRPAPKTRGKVSALLGACLCALHFSICASWAGDSGGQVAQFMSFGAGARSLAMGRAFFAVSDDATSIYSNPAGMTQLDRKEVSAMQATLPEETKLTTFNYVHPTNKGWVWGLNMTQLK